LFFLLVNDDVVCIYHLSITAEAHGSVTLATVSAYSGHMQIMYVNCR
jgi:hypothetical protein